MSLDIQKQKKLSAATLNYRFKFLGQPWLFLKRQLEKENAFKVPKVQLPDHPRIINVASIIQKELQERNLLEEELRSVEAPPVSSEVIASDRRSMRVFRTNKLSPKELTKKFKLGVGLSVPLSAHKSRP